MAILLKPLLQNVGGLLLICQYDSVATRTVSLSIGLLKWRKIAAEKRPDGLLMLVGIRFCLCLYVSEVGVKNA